MEEPEAIFAHIEQFFAAQAVKQPKRKVLITAGPTYEKIDPVRFIGNYSSGKMGLALAEACAQQGWEVELVCGPIKGTVSHTAIKRIDVESAQQMYEACMERFASCDAAILCAAVADFTVDQVASQKIKRGPNGLEINLIPTNKITFGGLHNT